MDKQDIPSTDWKRPLVAALIVAAVTSMISLSIWVIQFRSTTGQELNSRRISLIEELSLSSLRVEYLRAFKIRILVAQMKLSPRMFAGKSMADLKEDESTELQSVLSQRYAFEYGKSLASDEEFSTMMSKLVTAQTYFGSEVVEAVGNLVDELSPERFDQYIAEYFQKPAHARESIQDLNALEIVNMFQTGMHAKLLQVLTAMKSEIDGG